jgi:hypothetical protein
MTKIPPYSQSPDEFWESQEIEDGIYSKIQYTAELPSCTIDTQANEIGFKLTLYSKLAILS